MAETKKVVVIGAGIIGVCTALALQARGMAVELLDADAPGRGASYGNAGGIGVTEVVPLAAPGVLRRVPGWLLDPLGPLAIRPAYLPRLLPWLWRFLRCANLEKVHHVAAAMSDLLRPTYDDFAPLMRDAGLAGEPARRGAITVYKTEARLAADRLVWQVKAACGIRARRIGPEEIRDREPALAPNYAAAMLEPDWGLVGDPYKVVTALAALFRQRGGALHRGRAIGFDHGNGRPRAVRTGDGGRYAFDMAVIAAGAWSQRLLRLLGERVPLETERGYNTTLPTPGVRLNDQVIFGTGKFVMTPLEMGLRIGGAAEFAGLDAPPNFARSKALLTQAARALPGLRTEGGTEWMGHRPTLPDSLPVIGRSARHANVFHAFGHGHLGLTQAPTTGRLIAELAAGETPGIDLTPFRVDRF